MLLRMVQGCKLITIVALLGSGHAKAKVVEQLDQADQGQTDQGRRIITFNGLGKADSKCLAPDRPGTVERLIVVDVALKSGALKSAQAHPGWRQAADDPVVATHRQCGMEDHFPPAHRFKLGESPFTITRFAKQEVAACGNLIRSDDDSAGLVRRYGPGLVNRQTEGQILRGFTGLGRLIDFRRDNGKIEAKPAQQGSPVRRAGSENEAHVSERGDGRA